jgi:hypothetical protein
MEQERITYTLPNYQTLPQRPDQVSASKSTMSGASCEVMTDKERRSMIDRSKRIIDIILDGDIPSAS